MVIAPDEAIVKSAFVAAEIRELLRLVVVVIMLATPNPSKKISSYAFNWTFSKPAIVELVLALPPTSFMLLALNSSLPAEAELTAS